MSKKEQACILVVDDDERKLLALETVLADLKQTVVCAKSGRDALRLLLRQDFAVILLDVNMPGMDGFETATLIRQRKHCESLPIIFITAYNDEMFVERGYSLGAVDYILAPVVPDVLRSKVNVFVQLYRQTEHIRRQARRLQQRSSQLSALANQLTDAEHRERRRLAQILHDDLQQLLVAAQMRTSTAACAIDNESARRELEHVQELIRQSIAKSRSLAIELSPPVLQSGGIKNVVNWLAGRFQENHGLKVNLVGDDDSLELPEHLRIFIYQCIRELLFNVVKHAGVPEATVHLCRENDKLCVNVEDRGNGFQDDSHERARSSTEHFGLSTIRERISYLNGSFTIDAVEGRGTLVQLSVPVPTMSSYSNGRSSRLMPPTQSSIAAARDRVSRVLLVDDHEMLRKGLRNLIESHADIQVVGEASDGEEAVAMASRLQPDVVVMDLSMPRMDGVEATRRIASALPTVQVIGLSMHDSAEKAQSICDAGAVSYLSKIGPPHQLVAAIRATRLSGALPATEQSKIAL